MVNWRCSILIIAGVCLFLFSTQATADSFIDPLRPHDYRAVSIEERATPPPVDTSGWTLSAVLTSTARMVAVVNGQTLREGDVLQGFRLVSVKADRVVLRKGRREVTLIREATGLRKKSVTEGNRK